MGLLINFCVFYWVQDRRHAWGQSSRGGHTELPKGPRIKRGGTQQAPEPKEGDVQWAQNQRRGMHNRHQNKRRGMLETMTLWQCALMTMTMKNKGSVRVKLKKNWKYSIPPLNWHHLKVWHLIHHHHIHLILQDQTVWDLEHSHHHHLQTGVWTLCLLLVFEMPWYGVYIFFCVYLIVILTLQQCTNNKSVTSRQKTTATKISQQEEVKIQIYLST